MCDVHKLFLLIFCHAFLLFFPLVNNHFAESFKQDITFNVANIFCSKLCQKEINASSVKTFIKFSNLLFVVSTFQRQHSIMQDFNLKSHQMSVFPAYWCIVTYNKFKMILSGLDMTWVSFLQLCYAEFPLPSKSCFKGTHREFGSVVRQK